MEAQNTQSGEELLREIRANMAVANRKAYTFIAITCAIPIVFTAGLWLFAVLAN
jgi:hypothetical protein